MKKGRKKGPDGPERKDKRMTEEKRNQEEYVIGNFSYQDKEEATRAITEQERIKRLEQQIDYNKPQVVYALYSKMLQNEIFKTPEGMLYLVHLQNYLYENEKHINGVIPLIPASSFTGEFGKEEKQEKREEERRRRREERRKAEAEEKLLIYKIVIGFLAAAVVGMLIIAGLSDSPNILNYRQKIQDEYVEWEQELREWEEELEEREAK